VIFTPFRKAIPFIDEATGLKPHEIAHFFGGQSVQSIERMQRKFEKTAKVAVCSIQVAEGFSLTDASEGLFLGCEWTMAANEQAEDRLHRFGQENRVRIQYVTHLGTIEEDLLALLEQKLSQADIVNRLVRR
jgi:hypothetical protein